MSHVNGVCLHAMHQTSRVMLQTTEILDRPRLHQLRQPQRIQRHAATDLLASKEPGSVVPSSVVLVVVQVATGGLEKLV